MAVHKLNDASVTVNSVDLSDHVKEVTVDTGADAHDDSAMADTTHSHIGGLLTASMTILFEQDYAASKVDATISGVGVGNTTTITVLPTSSAVSSTNPSWSGTMLLTGYKPVGGAVGDLHLTQTTWVSAGTLARATS